MGNSPPKTLEEVGIHLFYMGESLSNIESTLRDAPSRKEVDDLKVKIVEVELEIEQLKDQRSKTLKSLDDKYVSRHEFKVGLSTVTVILTIAVTLLNIWEGIRG